MSQIRWWCWPAYVVSGSQGRLADSARILLLQRIDAHPLGRVTPYSLIGGQDWPPCWE
jgi:hypothetical protein